MNGEATVSMILPAGLTRAEQGKLQRLEGAISARFTRAGLSVRLCLGKDVGETRVLNFSGTDGVAGTIRASDFLSAPDDEAVTMIQFVNGPNK